MNVPTHSVPQVFAGWGLLGSAILCARFAWAGSPKGRGISDAAFVVVGGRCVLSTGVRLDCPLGVAWPVPLPCATPLLHSDAHSSSLRTCALDWLEKVEGAATA